MAVATRELRVRSPRLYWRILSRTDVIEGYCKHAKSGKTRAKHLQRLTTKQKLRKRHRRRPQQGFPRAGHDVGRLRRARVEDRGVVRPLISCEVRQHRREERVTHKSGAPSRTILITREARLD